MMIHQKFRFWINLLNELNIISTCLKKVLKSSLSFKLHKILHFFYKKIPQIHIICSQFLQNIAKVTHSFQSLDYMSGSLVENPEGSYRKRLAQSFCYEQNSTISINSSSAVPKAQSWRCPALVIPPMGKLFTLWGNLNCLWSVNSPIKG